ncbi:hypothetical protein, partial [Propionivibrio sp.]|uniref:hypothetical protein n=1 Tax=Propionivibrio sp. TaxID=2212460 RepID=UPI003BF1DDC3
AANTFATHQAEGEIALAGYFVVGSGLTDEHALMLPEKQEKNRAANTIMALQNDFPVYPFWVCALNQWAVSVARSNKSRK